MFAFGSGTAKDTINSKTSDDVGQTVTNNAPTSNEDASNNTVEMTLSQRNAVKAAQDYLDFSAFSKKGLIRQLSSEYGDAYPVEDAEFAVNYLEENGLVDWNEQAYKSAKSYLEFSSFSKSELKEQLTSDYGESFTLEQADYALEKVGYSDGVSQTADNNPSTSTEESTEIDQGTVNSEESSNASGEMTLSQRNAVKAAQSYLDFSAFSKKGLINQLSSEYGDAYPIEDAKFAVNYLEENGLVDWNEQAYKSAKSYLEFSSFSKSELKSQLTSEYGEGFTTEQADYALEKVGY